MEIDLSSHLESPPPKASGDLKLKLTLSLPTTHPLAILQQELRQRGLKQIDWSDVVTAALEKVPTQWWTDKIEDLTPLEFRVQSALSDPAMREQLSLLLQNRTPSSTPLS